MVGNFIYIVQKLIIIIHVKNDFSATITTKYEPDFTEQLTCAVISCMWWVSEGSAWMKNLTLNNRFDVYETNS